MDLAAEMRTAGLTLDDHMLYTSLWTICLPNTRWRQGIWHLVTVSAAMTSSRLYESGATDFLETGRRVPTLTMMAMLCSPAAAAVVAAGKAVAAVAAGKTAGAVATGKVEAAAKEKVDVGDSKDEAVKAPTRAVVARSRLPAAMAVAPKPPKVLPPT